MKPTILLLIVCAGLSSCAWGPDSSPEVTAQAMSYGGNVPIMGANGSIAGAQHVGETHRKTMLHD